MAGNTQGSPINILHISDLHFGDSRYDHEVVFSALLDDLKITCQGASKPDLVIFSGDIAQSADHGNVYFATYEDVLERLLSGTGCSEQRFFLAPGNHDAHRKFIEDDPEAQRLFTETLATREKINDAYLSGGLEAFAKDKFAKFREINEFFGSSPILDDGIVRVDQINSPEVDIVTFNSAWLTNAGSKHFPKDEGKLLIPEAAVVAAKKLLRPDALKVLVLHHPAEWLNSSNAADFESAIDGVFHLRLFGHMHEPVPKDVTTAKGSCTRNQAGALYQGRDRYNGYSLISVDPTYKLRRVRLRSFFPKTSHFDAGVDVISSEGTFYSSDEAKKYWRDRAQLVDPDQLKQWIGGTLLPAAKKIYNVSISDRAVEDVFVPPPMFKRTGGTTEKDGVAERNDSPISMREVLRSHSNLVLYGRKDYGKTTLLQQIAVGIMEAVETGEAAPSVPILIDYELIKPGDRPVVRPLQFALLADLPDTSLKTILENGYATVLVDDVAFSSTKKWELLKKFVQEFPRNRFIFSSLPAHYDSIIAALSDDVVVNTGTAQHFEHVFLQQFNRSSFRNLVAKWDKSGSLDQEAVVNRLVSEMTSMSIPMTAVNGTILLVIYEEKTGFRPINRAALIEQFVEYALEKLAPEAIFRGALDYKTKEYLLSDLAAHMVKSDEYILSWNKIVEVIQASLNQTGLNFDVQAILRNFISVGILRKRNDDCLSFRYRAFLEYFVACKMRDNADFRDWVLAEQRYLKYSNEILYYAGLVRNDAALLEIIAARFDALNAKAAETEGWIEDLSQLDGFVPPIENEEDIFDDFARQMDIPALNQEERDQILDTDLLRDVEDRQEVYRPKLGDLGQDWTLGLLLYAGLLKNLELIADASKRKHLRMLLRAWGNLTAISLAMVPLIARTRGAKINGVTYEVRMPKEYSEQKIARIIYLDMPRCVSQMALGTMGSEKLERQLSEPELADVNEPLITQYYRSNLIASLRLNGWMTTLKKLNTTLQRRSKYLSEAFLRNLSDLYFLGLNSREESGDIQKLLADASGQLRGVDRRSVELIKNRTMQYAKQRELVRQLKAKALDHKPNEEN